MVFDLLTAEDKDFFVDYIEAYGDNDCGYRNRGLADVEHLLRFWNREKTASFGKIFKDSLILKREIIYKKDVYELETDICTMIYHEGKTFYNTYCDMFYSGWRFGAAYTDILPDGEDEKYDGMKNYMRHLVDFKTLATNTWDGKVFTIYFPKGSMKVFPGAKIMRVLGKVAKEFDIPGFKEFREAHSRIIDQGSLVGTMCLSIHPMDYLTMSDNRCNWSSCMNWEDQGEYRMGTVEMMNSPYVIVGYLEDEDGMRTAGHEWNSKRWRELYVVDEQIISNIKSYPYYNFNLTRICMEWLKDLATEAGIGTYRDEFMEYSEGYRWRNSEHCDPYLIDNGIFIEIEPGCDSAMYNDFGNNEPHCFIGADVKKYTVVSICYSGETECMCCGDNTDTYGIPGTSFVFCSDCSDYQICDCCDEPYNPDEGYYVDGMYICPICFDERTLKDDLTDEVHMEDNMTKIYLCDDDYSYTFTNTFIHVYNSCSWNCDDILEDIDIDELSLCFKEGVKPYVSMAQGEWYNVRVIKASDMNEYGIAKFCQWGFSDFSNHVGDMGKITLKGLRDSNNLLPCEMIY